MREIKFRALGSSGWLFFTLEQLIDGSAEFFKEHNLKHWSQFTGLRDKNGKEIYEGDIVKGVFYRDGEKIECPLGKVIWGFGVWEVYMPIHFYTPKLYELHSGNDECVEVIGNIYENKDLLEEKV